MKIRGPFPGIAMIDVCINLVLVFAVLLKLSVAAVNHKSETEHKSPPPNSALYLIRVQWPGDSLDDVDTYVSDPAGHLVYFRRLSDGLMILDHDDTGADSNTVTLPNGETVISAFNEETVEIRGIIPGEYIVNLQMYRKVKDEPTQAAVTLYRVAGGEDVKIHDQTVTMAHKGDEETAFRFTLTKDGDVVDVNRLQKRMTGI